MGENEDVTEPLAIEPEVKEGRFKRRLILALILAVCIAVGWFLSVTVVPRWWGRTVGNIVEGSHVFGTFFGLAVGAAFTVLPLIALRAGWKFRAGWKRWIKFVVLAFVLAAPNLMTLGVVIGDGDAAVSGAHQLRDEAPGFRNGSLVGTIGGVVLVAGISLMLRSRRKTKAREAELKAELEGLK